MPYFPPLPEIRHPQLFKGDIPSLLKDAARLKRHKQLGALEDIELKKARREEMVAATPEEILAGRKRKAEKEKRTEEREDLRLRLDVLGKAVSSGTGEGAKAIWKAFSPSSKEEDFDIDFSFVGDDDDTVKIKTSTGLSFDGPKAKVADALKRFSKNPDLLSEENMPRALADLAEQGISVEAPEAPEAKEKDGKQFQKARDAVSDIIKLFKPQAGAELSLLVDDFDGFMESLQSNPALIDEIEKQLAKPANASHKSRWQAAWKIINKDFDVEESKKESTVEIPPEGTQGTYQGKPVIVNGRKWIYAD